LGRILVVDDDPVNRRVTERFLLRLGYACRCIADVPTTLRHLLPGVAISGDSSGDGDDGGAGADSSAADGSAVDLAHASVRLSRADEGTGLPLATETALTSARSTRALEAATGGGTYDAVLLDIFLGDRLTGVDICQALRAHGYAGIVLPMTANGTTADLALYRDAGFSPWALVKPFTVQLMGETLREALRVAAGARAAGGGAATIAGAAT